MKVIDKIHQDPVKRNRMKLRLTIAMREKLKQGEDLHGKSWQGDAPLVEAFDDMLDVLVYLKIAKEYHRSEENYESGIDDTLENLICDASSIADSIVDLFNELEG